jgi:porin
MNKPLRYSTVALSLTGLIGSGALAQTSDDPPPAPPKPAEGLVPIPDYSGDLASRRFLSGDWGGARTDLANRGLTLDLDWTQWAQGVVSGGERIDWDYGGTFDVAGTFDLMRMGLLPGAMVTFRVESRYGESVNDDSGSLVPVNADAVFPITGSLNEGIVAVTQLSIIQFLSEKLALSFGKVQTLGADPNEFASGRGTTQFMNFSLLASPVTYRTVPYSALAAGVVILPTKRISISSTLLTTEDSSTNSGFDNVGDGWTWASEADFQYTLGNLPGGFNLGVTYAFANDFAELNGKFQIRPRTGVVLPVESESWSVYLSGWQYVYTPDKAPEKINVADGKADLRGLGIFARFGFADEDTNPVDWSASGGLGGRGLIPGRDQDTWAIAFVHNSLTDTRLGSLLDFPGSAQLVEAYYSLAISPASDLTFDAQWVESSARENRDATLLGVRFSVRF